MFISDRNNTSFIEMNYHTKESRNMLKRSNKNVEIEKEKSLVCCKTKSKKRRMKVIKHLNHEM